MDPSELARLDREDRVEEAEQAIIEEYRRKYPGAPWDLDVIAFHETRLTRLAQEGREDLARQAYDRLEHWTRVHVSSATAGGEAAAYLAQVKPILARCRERIESRFPRPPA